MRLSAEQVQFFERFARSPEAAFLRTVLQAVLDESHKDMRTLEGAAMYRAQGAAVCVDALIANLSGKLVQAQPTKRPMLESRPVPAEVW
jgi:hypothetical protein